MQEASKAMNRRSIEEYGKYFVGYGIDIGCGDDAVDKWQWKFKEMTGCKHWDMPDGDAQVLASVPYNKYDWAHSSHSLEHMRNWAVAIKNWIRVLKRGGHLIVSVPSWEMYERKIWPSTNNWDHKWAFTLSNEKKPWLVNISEELLSQFGKVISIKNLDQGFDPNVYGDQTLGSAECAIEFVIQK